MRAAPRWQEPSFQMFSKLRKISQCRSACRSSEGGKASGMPGVLGSAHHGNPVRSGTGSEAQFSTNPLSPQDAAGAGTPSPEKSKRPLCCHLKFYSVCYIQGFLFSRSEPQDAMSLRCDPESLGRERQAGELELAPPKI